MNNTDNSEKRIKLVVFDMDSTLIDAETIDELAEAAGVGEKVAMITEMAMHGELDYSEALTERVHLLEGLTLERHRKHWIGCLSCLAQKS